MIEIIDWQVFLDGVLVIKELTDVEMRGLESYVKMLLMAKRLTEVNHR